MKKHPINHQLTPEERNKRNLARRYTLSETRDQEDFVLDGIVSGQDRRYIARSFCEKFNTKLTRYHVIRVRMLAHFKETHNERIKTAKAEAIERQMRHLSDLQLERMRMDPSDFKARANHSNAIVKVEQLLADLTGAREPLKVEINVQMKESIQQVIVNMSPEQINEHLHRAREDRRLAQLARERLVVEESEAAE